MQTNRCEPSYLKLHRAGQLSPRAQQLTELLANCTVCPRVCLVNRLENKMGVCRTGAQARVAAFHPHFGEEAPLVGSAGSGTIFFSCCNLYCSFCQNFEISHLGEGDEVSPRHLATMMIRLKNLGCHNINLVTPTHVIPQILQALVIAIDDGLDIPLVYNSSGYDRAETIKMLDGIIDIYMPDFKFWDETLSDRLCRAPDYRVQATAAIREMHRQVGDLVMNDEGLGIHGLLVRHLVMPHGLADTKKIMTFIAEEISPDTYVNIMAQYRPCGKAMQDPMINRRITAEEFAMAIREAVRAGIKRLDHE